MGGAVSPLVQSGVNKWSTDYLHTHFLRRSMVGTQRSFCYVPQDSQRERISINCRKNQR